MSLTCQLCERRCALVEPQFHAASGERKFMCIACAAQQPVPPGTFPEGTQRTTFVTVRPANDIGENERANFARIAEEAQGRAALYEMMLRRLYYTFPELRTGLTNAVQQQVLRDVRAVLEEGK